MAHVDARVVREYRSVGKRRHQEGAAARPKTMGPLAQIVFVDSGLQAQLRKPQCTPDRAPFLVELRQSAEGLLDGLLKPVSKQVPQDFVSMVRESAGEAADFAIMLENYSPAVRGFAVALR